MAFMVLMVLLLPIAILPEYSADPEDDGSEDEHQNDGYVLGPNITDDMWDLEDEDEYDAISPENIDDGPLNWPQDGTAIQPEPDTPDVLHEARGFSAPSTISYAESTSEEADAAPDQALINAAENIDVTPTDSGEMSQPTEDQDSNQDHVDNASHQQIETLLGSMPALASDATTYDEEDSVADEQESQADEYDPNHDTETEDQYETDVEEREDGVWQVSPFDASTDKFEVNLKGSENSHNTVITVEPSADGEDGEIYINDNLYAVLKGAPDATIDNTYITRN